MGLDGAQQVSLNAVTSPDCTPGVRASSPALEGGAAQCMRVQLRQRRLFEPSA